MSLSWEERQTFEDYGFLVKTDMLDKDVITKVAEKINNKIKEIYPTDLPKSKTDAELWVKAKSKLQREKDLLSLIDPIIPLCRNLIGYKIDGVYSCQIASRFPGEGTNCSEWHIDNFTEKDLGRDYLPNEFNLLIGVLLTDNLIADHGNFTCYPGGHHQIKAFGNKLYRDMNITNVYEKWIGYEKYNGHGNVVYHYLKDNGLDKYQENIKLSCEFQVLAPMGTIIFVDRMLPHKICAPNTSDSYIRTIVWFRISKSEYDYEKFINPKIFMNSTLQFLEDIIIQGCGYLYSIDDKKMILRIKPRIKQHIPNLFASMVNVTINIRNMKLMQIYTNGFLSHSSHMLWLQDLKNKNITEIIQIINDIDYDDLIKKWYPAINIETDNSNIVSNKIIFHHIKSLSKTGMMERWARDFNIDVNITRGFQGTLIATGRQENINKFINRVMALHWNVKPIVQHV